MKKHNLAFIDIETTGLNLDVHEIIEIGIVLVRQNRVNGKHSFEMVKEIEIKIKPERIEDADPTALKVNKYDPAQWVFAYNLEEGMRIFAKETKDAIMVAHNATFDWGFLDKAFRSTGIENSMHYHKLDTVSVSFAKLHNNDDIDRFSLRSLCQYFGIENKRAHTALSDARATFEVYKKLMKL